MPELSEEELKELADQLRCPNGEQGILVAENMNSSNASMISETIESIPFSKVSSILELGHGNCSHLAALLSKKTGISYYGLEISEAMQATAFSLNKSLTETGNIFFGLYNGTDIPFNDNQFDCVFSVNTIYFWEKPEKLLTEIYRALKPGGSLLLTFTSKETLEKLAFSKFGFTLYTLSDVENLTTNAGFIVERIMEKKENAISKIGTSVERTFYIIQLKK